MRSRRSVHPSLVLILLSVLATPAWGAPYTWTGGGGADTSWTNNANWGGGGHPTSAADTATINGAVTVTLTANATVGTLDFDYGSSGLVTFNLGGFTLTASTINFGSSGGGPPPACNVNILGPGTITTGTMDTNQSTNNTVNFSNNVSTTVTGTFWGNQNPGTATTYSGDGTCTLTLSGTLGSDPTVVFDNLTVVAGGVSYTVTVTGSQAPGQTVAVTITGGFAAATQFQYKAVRTNSNVTTTEAYTLKDKDGLNPIVATLAAVTPFPNTSAVGTFQFQLQYPPTIDNGDGLNFIIYNPAGTFSIGSVAFIESTAAATWIGGNPGTPTDWSDPANWSPAAVPTGTSVVTIPVTANNPVLTANATAMTVKVDPSATLDLAGFNLTGVTTLTNNGKVRLQGTETVAGTKANGASSTVEYYGAGAITPVWGNAYQNLTVSGATTALSLGASTTVNGNLVVSAGNLVTGTNTLTLSGPSHQVTGGTLTLSSGGGLSAGTNALTIGPSGTLDTSGTLTAGNFASTGTVTNSASNTVTASGTVSVSGTFSSAANSTLTMTGTKTLSAAVPLGNLALSGTNTVTVSGSALSLAGTLTIGSGTTLTDAVGNLGLTVSGTTTITGTLTAGSGTDNFATVTGTGSLGASTGTTTVTGDLTVTGFTHNSGTLVLGGAGAHLLSVSPVNNLTVSGGGAVTLGAALTVAGNLALTSGSLDVSAVPYGLTLGGNLSGAGTLVPQTGTVTFTGTGAQTAASFTFYNVVANKAGGSLAMTNPTMNGWATGASKAFSASFPSGGSSATAVTFNNTGSLSVANGFTFTLGVTATVPSSVTLGGTIGSTNQVLNFGAAGGVTLAADTVLSSGSAKTTLGGALGGAGFSLTLNTMGATSAFGGVVTGLANLTVNTGTTFSLAGNATLTGLLTVTSSTLAVAGSTLTFGSYSGTGDTITTTSGTLTVPGASAGGTIGTLTVTTGVTLNGGSGATGIVVTGLVAGNLTTTGKVTLNGTGIGTLTNTGTLTLNGALTTSGTLTNTGGTVAVVGNVLTFPTYTGGSGDTVTTTSGTLTVPGAAAGGTIGTLTVTTGATLNGGTGATGIVVTGLVAGNLTTSGKVTLNGTGIGTLTNTGTLTLNGVLTTSGTLTNTGGTVVVVGNVLTFPTYTGGSGDTVTTTSGTLTVPGASAGGTIGTLTVTTGATLNGGSGATGIVVTGLVAGNLTTSGKVTLNGTGIGTLTNTGTLTLNGALTTSGTLTNTGGTVAVVGNVLTFPTYTGGSGDTVTTTSGTLTVPGASAGGTIGTLTVTTGATLNGGSGATGIVVTGLVAGNLTTSGKVTLNGTGIGTLTNTGTLTLNGNATLSGNLSQTGGTLTVPNGDTLTLNGAANAIGVGSSLVIATGGVVTAGTNPVSVAGTLNTSGSLTAGDFTSTGTITNTATNSITASGAVSISGTFGGTANFGTIVLTGAASSLTTAVPLGNLAVNATATAATLGSGLSLGGTLLVNALGVLSAGTFGLTVTGTTTVNGTLNGGSGTDQFAAVGGTGTLSATTGSTTISGGLSVTAFTHNSGSVTLTGGSTGAYTFNNLTVGGTVSATGDWTVAGNLTISGGANWTAGAHVHSVAGNWTNSGTFTGAGSTIAFTGTGTHTLTGATTFVNLTDTTAGSTLTLTTGTTFGVSGTLTLTGASGSLITVQSSSGTATLGNTSAQVATFVQVSNVLAGATGITASNSKDATGTNTNWVFSAVSWLTIGTANANLATNWASGVVPGQFDTATVPSGGTQPVQTAPLVLKGLVTQASGTWSNGGQNLTLGTSSLVNGGFFTFTGSGTFSGLPASMGGTFVYSGGTVSMVAGVTTYTDLTVSGGSITAINATVTGTTSVTGGTFTVPGGVTLNLAVTSVSAGGTVATSGTVNLSDLTVAGAWNNSASNTVTASGNVSITGSYGTPGSGTLALTGAAKTLASTPQLGNLTVTGTPKLTAALSLAGNLLITAGSLDMNGQAVTLAGSQLRGTVVNTASATSPTFQATSGITLTGATSLTTFTTSAGGNVTFSGSVDGGQTLTVAAGAGAVSFGTVGASPALTSLTVTTTGTLALGSVTTTGTQGYTAGGATLSGTLTTTGAGGTIGFLAATPLVLGTDSQLNTSASGSTITLGGTVDGNHVLTLVGGTINASAALGGITPLTGLTLTSGTLALGANPLSVYGPLVLTSGSITGSGNVTLRGNLTRGTGTLSRGGGTLVLDGTTAAQSVDLAGSTIVNLTANNTSGTPTVTLGGYPTALNWSGNVTLTSGSLVLGVTGSPTIGGNITGTGTLDASTIAGTLTVNGTIGTNLAGVGALVAPAGNLSVGGAQFNATSFTASGGTVTFTAATTIYSASSFANLSKSGVGTTTSFNTGVGLSATGTVTVSSGTLALVNTASSIGGTLTGAGIFDASAMTSTTLTVSGPITMAGTLKTPTSTGILEANGTSFNVTSLMAPSGTVLFNGTSAVALTTNAQSFNHLTLATGTKTVTATGVVTVAGNLEVGAGQTLNAANAGLSVTGTTNAAQTTNGTITGGAGGGLTFTGSFEVGSLTAATGTTSFGGATVVFHTFAANGGTVQFTRTGAQAWTTGGATLATLTLSAGAPVVTTTGSFTSSTLTMSTGQLVVSAADTLTLTGSSNLTGGTLTLTGGLAASGSPVTINGATVTVATQPFVTGTLSIATGSFNQTGDNAGNANTVAALTVSGGTMNWDSLGGTPGGSLTISGLLSQTAGTLNFHNKNVTFGTGASGSFTVLDLTIPNGKTLTPSAGASITVLRHLDIQAGGAYAKTNNPTLILGGGSGMTGNLGDNNGTLSDLGTLVVANQDKTLTTALKASSVDIRSGGILRTNGNNLTVSGQVTTSIATGTLVASTTEIISVGSHFTVGTFTRGTGDTVTLSSATSGFSANLAAGYTFTNLTVAKTVGDAVLPAGATTVAGVLTLTSGTWTAAGTTLTTAGNWTSNGASFTFTAGTGTVVLTSANPTITHKAAQGFNNLTLNGGGTLGANLTVGGTLAVGAVTPASLADGGFSLAVTGNTTVTAGTNALSWTNAANDFVGTVAVTNSGANNVSIRDANALALGTWSVGTGTLTVRSNGALTQSGAGLAQAAGAGAASFTAGAAVLTLNNAGNDFTGPVSLSNSGANAVSFRDATGLDLGVVSVGSSTLTLQSGGALTQSAGGVTSTGTVVLIAGGSITLDEAGGTNSIPNLGAVTRGGAFVLNDHGALALTGAIATDPAAVTIATTGALSLATGANITTSGGNVGLTGVGVTSAGTQTVSAGTGTVTVNGGGGAINLVATTTLTATAGVTVRAATTVALPTITSAGTVTVGVTSDVTGNVTQVGGVTAGTFTASLGGTAALTLTGTNTLTNLGAVGTNGAVQITSSGAPSVTGAVATSGSDLTISTAGLAITTGSLNTGAANTRLDSSAAVTQTGTITTAGLQLTGTGSFTLGAANTVTTLAVSTTAGSVALTAVGSVAVGAVSVNSNLVTGVNTGGQTLVLNTAGATQSASITVSGLAVVGTGTFTLTNTSNSLAVVASSVTGSVSLYSTGAVSVGTVGGTVGLTASGTLSLNGTGAWTQGGTQNLTAANLRLQGTGPYTFTNAGNDIGILAGLVSGDVTYTDANAVVIGTVTTVGLSAANVTLVVNGAGGGLTQTSVLTSTGLLRLTAGTNAVVLGDGTNGLATVNVLSSGALTLNDANGYTLNAVTASGNVDLSSVTGDLTIASANVVATTGTATQNLHPVAGQVIVNGQVSTVGGQVTFNPSVRTRLAQTGATAAAVSTGGGNLVFSTPVLLVSAANTVTATSGATTFSAAVGGAAGGEPLTVNAGSGQVTFSGVVGTLSPGNLTVTSAGATGVTFAQTVTLTGALTVTNGGAVLVQGTVQAPAGFSSTGTTFNNTGGTITTTGTSLTVNHTGAVTIGAALSSGAGAVAVTSSASTVNLGASVGTTSGTVAVDSQTGTTVSASGTVTTTAAGGTVRFGASLPGTLTTSANVTTSGSLVQMNRNTTLGANVAIATTGGGATAGAAVGYVGTLAGGAHTLTVNAGTGGAVTFAAAVDNLALLSLTQSGGLTASGTWGAGTAGAVTVVDTAAGQTVAFRGAQTNITTLTTGAGTGAYHLRIDGSATPSTISSASLSHTGNLVLGNSAAADLLFTGGLNAATVAATTLQGTVRTANTPLVLSPGAVTLAAASTLSTGATTTAGDLTLAAVTGAGFALTLETGAAVAGADATVASVAGVGVLTLQNLGGTARFNGTVGAAQVISASTVGLVDLRDNLTAGPAVVHSFGGPVQFAKVGSTQTLTFAGAATFSAQTDATQTSQPVSLTATTLNWNAASSSLLVGQGGITLTGNVDFTSGSLVGSVFATPPTITFNAGSTVVFGNLTANGNPIAFTGAGDTAWTTNGRTMAAVTVNKTAPAVLTLASQALTTGAVTILSTVTASGTTATPTSWTVASGGVSMGATVNWVDSRLTLQGGNLTVSGALNLSTTVASGAGGIRGIVFSGTGQTLGNTGPVTLVSTVATSPVHVLGGTTTTWPTGNPTWTAGDLALGSLTHAGALTQPAGSFLYLLDSGVTLNAATLAGTVRFDGFPTGGGSKDLTLTGSLNIAAATIQGHTGGSTVTFNNAGAASLTAATPATGKTLHSLTLGGSGTLTLASDLGLSGNLTQTAGNLDADVAAPATISRWLVVQGSVSLAGTVIAPTNRLQLVLAPSGNVNVGSAGSLAAVDLWVAADIAAARTLTQTTNLTVHRLTALVGTWQTGGHNLTTGEDFVAFGPGFATEADSERATTRGAGNTLLGYPYWSAAARTAFNTLLSGSGFASLPSVPLVSNLLGASFLMNAGDQIVVGRNFYDHGASMTPASGTWTLTLSAAKFGTFRPGDPARVATDWFGLPFAVALNTSATRHATITGSLASQPVAAAWSQVVGTQLIDGTGNTQWGFTAPVITSARTRFDNLVEVEFSKAMLTSGSPVSQLSLALGQTLPVDNLRFGGGTVNAASAVSFEDGDGVARAVGASGEYATGAVPTDDSPLWIAFQTQGTATWNTDATGASAGAANSRDRTGVHQTLVPDLTAEKGRFFDAFGNPLANYGTNGVAVYSATLDRARPVLYQVTLGQAAKAFPPTTFEDGHNYWHLQWTEPVDLDTSVVGINGVGTIGSTPAVLNTVSGTDPNLASVLAFGDSYTVDGSPLAGKVQLTGLVQYTGNLYRGRRSLAEATPQTSQTVGGKTSNTLARSSTGDDLYVYLAGASTGLALAKTWDGFWWGDTTSPSGQVYTVAAAYVNQVKDRSAGANPVEDEFVSWPAAGAAADPKVNSQLANVSVANKWEVDAPVLAPYTVTGTNDEVVPFDSTGSADVINQVQFHVLANVANSGQGWDSQTGHPDTTQAHYGVRDTSLSQFIQGFALGLQSGGGTTTTYNLSVSTGVDNSLFNGGPPPATGFTTADDGYFSVNLKPVPSGWKPTVPYTYTYSPFTGMATNLAGRLVAAKTGNAVDRTPPYITLTLAPNSGKKVYVQFSRTVQANSPTSDPTLKDVLLLSGSANSIVSLVPTNPSGLGYFQEAVLTLTSPFDPAEFATARIRARNFPAPLNTHGDSTITSSRNDMDWTVTYPLSSLGIDLVQPVWASDGSGAEANQSGTANVIHNFAGGESLVARDITLQAKVFGGTTFNNLPLQLSYDFSVAGAYTTATGLWLPTGIFEPSGLSSNKVPATGNPSVRNIIPTSTNAAGDLKTFLVPGGDPKMASGNELQFIFRIGAFYGVRGLNLNDPTQLGVYRIPLKGVKTQKNGVTILHNVIDPTQGQQTQLLYTMKKSGVVTAQVFALDGSLVRVLHRGRQAPGDYTLFWDGKNEGGKIVARGIYFIRVVAPDTDETRNVMVIK